MTDGFEFTRPTTSKRSTPREEHGTPLPIEDAAFLRQTRIQEPKPTSQNGETHSIDWLTNQAESKETNTPRRSVTLSEKYPKPTGTKMLFNNLQKQEASFTMPTMNHTVTHFHSLPSYASPRATNASMTTSPSPIAPHQGTIAPNTPRTQKQDTVYKISGDHKCVKMFLNAAFRQKLVNSINKDFGVTLDIQSDEADSFHSSTGYVLQFNGASINIVRAHEVIEILFETAFTKKVFGRAEGFVIYKVEAMKLIERLVDENEMLCLYQFSDSDGLIISYFTSKMSSIKAVCMNDKTISSLIGEHFLGESITIPKQWNDTMIDHYLQTMVEFCRVISEEERVLIEKETDQYLVFGLRESVEALLAAQVKLQKEFVINPCQLGFEQYQIQFLILNFQKDLERLENDYRNLSILHCLKENYFVGPTPIHTKIKELLNQMVANVTRNQFVIDDHHLGLTIVTQQDAIHKIASTYGCDVVVEIIQTSRTCQVPIVTLAMNNAASMTTAMSVDIRVGDLAEQSVDMVVICSTSENLLTDILQKAGNAVENEVRTTLQNKNCRESGFHTTGGDLLCRRLLFLPWLTKKLDDAAARRSIHTFFSIAIKHAIEHRQTSLAFPALGCGQLKYDPNMIAEVILDEVQRYSDCNLNILIVLLSEDGEAYPAFCHQLANLRRKKPPKEQTSINYIHAAIKATLTGHQENVNKAVEAISIHARNSVTSEQFNEFPLHSWSQPTIDAYFRYCIENCVLPKVDVTDEKLTLVGTKEDIMTTSREFYRIKGMKAEEARLASFARIAVWIYNTRQGYTKKYSLKLNALIEEAHHQRKKEICFRNDDNVDCRLNFNDMKEKSENEQRIVIRTDFQAPAEWALQSTDIQRFRLELDDPGYIKVLEQFNQTMTGKCEIIRIERIQNKRWYTAYRTFRDYSQQSETEEYLFHGCPKTSADMIINTCFNRSFAGVNGIVYGVGVYFSRNALYSHGFTRLNPTNNQRCMFLARVLVGKTTLGNQSMRVPPAGFDSTTDNKHIIVTYHDDQAYAEYLITYQ